MTLIALWFFMPAIFVLPEKVVLSDIAGLAALAGVIGHWAVQRYQVTRLEGDMSAMKESLGEKLDQKFNDIRDGLAQQVRETEARLDHRLGRIEDLMMRRRRRDDP